MKYSKKIFINVFFTFLAFSILFSCEAQKEKKHKKHKKEKAALPEELKNLKDNGTTINCDTSFWKYVYNPERLQVLEKCKTVTGMIEESNADEDGDQHMLLKLDSGQGDLLTKRNVKKKQDDLVIEAVCINSPTLRKVGSTCEGYVNHIQLPKQGDRVKVTGTYVLDSHNGWTEIHPIMKI